MISFAPRLRSDLTVRHQQTANGPLFVVKDPVSGEFFRFRETEQFIAQQLDGETPLDLVRERTEVKFGAMLPAETLGAFIKKLDKAGLLETQEALKTERASHRGRIRGSLLYLRFALFDPDRLFNLLVRRVRLLFTPQFVALSAALILLAVGTTTANWSELTQDVSRLYRLSAVPLLLAVAFVVAAAHEFAHGLTCKRFGGEVHELGFLLIYFTPALYTNVSDAWLFPAKAKRLWVGFAGPYFELFLWALATLTWRLTDAQTSVNYLALTVMAVSGIKTLFNFNPFIKLDGYYLLSDYLELPNLRRKSFKYVGVVIKRLLGVGHRIATELSRRERRVYLAYGLVATVCSMSLLTYILVTAGGFLLANQQPMALLLLTSLVGMRSRRRFRKLFGGSPDPSDPADDGDDSAAPQPGPAPSSEPSEPREKKRKRKASWKRRVRWSAVVAALALLFLGRMELRVAGPVSVLPEENADVRAAVEGIIEEVYVDEGNEVRAGDVIARLSDEDLLPELRKTEAAVRETRANLEKLEAGPTAEEIEVARAVVSRAEDRLRYAQSGVTRLSSLFEANVVTRQELEAAQELATTSANDLAEARGRLGALLRRTRPEDVDATKARIDQLETQRRHLEEHLRLLTIVSPVTGIVATPSRQLKAMEGQLVGRGALIAKVYDFTTVVAHIVISEKEIADVRVGQQVVIRARAYPNVAFRGTVTSIATAAEGISTPGAEPRAAGSSPGGGGVAGQTFVVSTRIDNGALLLKPGMTGHAKVVGGQRRVVDLIARRLAHTFKIEVWSWW